jgi:hypothetical protein
MTSSDMQDTPAGRRAAGPDGPRSDLAILKSHSRPEVSNDNPYSEAQFKTLKYCPAVPGMFGSL